MTIETKYNIGDEIWFMKDNRPVQTLIIDIRIYVAYKGNGQSITDITYGTDSCEKHQDEVYTSKKELLESL